MLVIPEDFLASLRKIPGRVGLVERKEEKSEAVAKVWVGNEESEGGFGGMAGTKVVEKLGLKGE